MNKEECDRLVERVVNVLDKPALVEAMKARLDPTGHTHIAKSLERMRRTESYISVVGSQGTGKSSLLNSLLFPNRTLPVGEGTTTNVVCLLRDSGNGEPRCEIAFGDGPVKTFPLSRDSLDRHLDEAFNRANRLGVMRVTCFLKHELLTDGAVFVDTPGLGSLIDSHDTRTLEFAHEISLGIFVLRTSPSLTTQEGIYLENIWHLCPEWIFIQNVWGERASEVDRSLEDNLSKLRKIAQSQGDGRSITLLPINVHAGLDAATNSRPGNGSSSGLAALQRLLVGRVSKGGRRLEIAQQGGQIAMRLERAALGAETELAAAAKGGDDLEMRRLKGRIDDVESSLSKFRSDHANRTQRFRSHCERVKTDSKRRLEDKVDSVRETFLTRLDDSDVEAELSRSLQRASSTAYADFRDRLADVCDNYTAESASEIDKMASSMSFDIASGADDLSGTRLAEAAGKFTAWAGGITVTALTAISANAFGLVVAAGGTVTTAIAAGAAAIPVIGWVVAGVTLGAGMMIRSAARDKRRESMRSAIRQAGEKTLREAGTAIGNEADRICADVRRGVDEFFRGALAQQEMELNQLREMMSLSDSDRRAHSDKLRAMAGHLSAGAADVRHLTGLHEAPV